ncbi:MAG: hypothetical protein OEL83_09820 [Desulforhopalus sp.]|nr:hypothetical protein [Desulforhopalus sp.]
MEFSRKKLLVPAVLAGTILAAWLGLQITVPWYTRLLLKDGATGRQLLSVILADGESAALTWHNSLFDLDVTEDFIAEKGLLVQTAVTFADPRGLPPMRIAPEEVDDFYHTGGPFTTTGLRRPFSRIVYRVGDIGKPSFTAGNTTIKFKNEVGFGGQVVLSTTRPNLYGLVVESLQRVWR